MALSRRTRSTRVLVVVLVMLSLTTITIDFRSGQDGPLAEAGKAAVTVVGPLQDAVSRVVRPVADFVSGVINIGSLKAENERLTKENQRLRLENVDVSALERELDELIRLLGLKEGLGFESLPATVIAESPGNLEWVVTIDRGTADGIAEDMPVVNADGLVGHVVLAAAQYSQVELIIDPDSVVAGRLGHTGETGLVEGQREGDLRMELVDRDAKVAANEQVVTSGYQGGLYPPGLLVGFVSHVFRETGSLSKLVSVRPAVDFSALGFVLVITGAGTGPAD